jgi:hypothetical protein
VRFVEAIMDASSSTPFLDSIAALHHTYVNVSPRWLSQPEGGAAVHRIRSPGIRTSVSEIVDPRGPKGE